MSIFRHFKPQHIMKYVKNLPFYYKANRYNGYIDFLTDNGLHFGIIKGSDEAYLFEIEDRAIPFDMFLEKKTFSKENIDKFIEIVAKRKNNCKIGGVFLDIGANIGTTSIYVAKHYGENLAIWAFEPDHVNYKLLRCNIELNDCQNVHAINVALSDKEDTVSMEVNRANRGGTKIISNESKANAEVEYVSAVPFDSWLKEHVEIAPQDINYIWIDVEGHESFVIDGMIGFLREYKPPICMEVTPKNYGGLTVSENDFLRMYEKLASVYKEFIIIKDPMTRVQIDKLKEMYYNQSTQADIVLID